MKELRDRVAVITGGASGIGLACAEKLAAEGKQADIIVLDAPTYHHLVYNFGVNPVRHVVKSGRPVVRDRELV